jgi:hypothetical protein
MGYISEKIGNLEHSQNLANQLAAVRLELEDTKKLLRFQEMHKSAEMLKDQTRMDWLLKNSCIIVGGIYITSRESLDGAMSAESANEKS